ncbi:hypothetical protein ES705_22575 [subsurface metagenome]
MKKQYRVKIREIIDGPVVRLIEGINPYRSACGVACMLMISGERNLTVTIGKNKIAGQVLTGRHNGGWYCGQGKLPEYLRLQPIEKTVSQVPGP